MVLSSSVGNANVLCGTVLQWFLLARMSFTTIFVKFNFIIAWFVFLKIDEALQEGVAAMKLLTSKGLTESSRCFNTEQKYKHIRVQNMQT